MGGYGATRRLRDSCLTPPAPRPHAGRHYISPISPPISPYLAPRPPTGRAVHRRVRAPRWTVRAGRAGRAGERRGPQPLAPTLGAVGRAGRAWRTPSSPRATRRSRRRWCSCSSGAAASSGRPLRTFSEPSRRCSCSSGAASTCRVISRRWRARTGRRRRAQRRRPLARRLPWARTTTTRSWRRGGRTASGRRWRSGPGSSASEHSRGRAAGGGRATLRRAAGPRTRAASGGALDGGGVREGATWPSLLLPAHALAAALMRAETLWDRGRPYTRCGHPRRRIHARRVAP